MTQDIFTKLANDLPFGASPAAAGTGTSDPASAIRRVAQERGTNADYLLGLAQLETRGGKATIRGDGVDTRNLFNIKDFSKAGTGIRALDKAEGSRDRYRQYDSHEESVVDLVDLLSRKYPRALTAQTPEEFAAALKRGGYATDPDYERKLASTIKSVQGKGGAPAPAPVEQWDQGARYVPMEQLLPGGQPPIKKPAEGVAGVIEGVSELPSAVWQGAKSLGRSIMASGNTAVGNLSDVELLAAAQKKDAQNDPKAMTALKAEIEARKKANPDAPWWKAVGDVSDAAWQNKLGTAQLIANQAPNAAVSLGGGWAGGVAGAKLGALAAPFTGGLSVPVGAGVGALAGMFLGSYAIESGGKAIEKAEGGFTQDEADAAMTEGAKAAAVMTVVDRATLGAGKLVGRTLFGAPVKAGARAEAQVLADAGVDITSKKAIAKALTSNPALKKSALDAGQKAAKAASGAGKRATQAGTALTMESFGEGVGEYYGEEWATGNGNVYDAALEALSSGVQSSVQTAKSMVSVDGNQGNLDNIVRAAKQPGGIVSRAAVAGQPAKPGQPAQTPVAAGAGAQAQEADPTFAEMSDSVLLQLQRSLQERQAAGDEDITDDEIELAQAAKAEYERRMASTPPTAPDPEPAPVAQQPTNTAAPAQPAGVSVSGGAQPATAKAQPAITVDLNPAPRAPSPFDAVPLEQDPAITQQQREDAAKVQDRRRKNMATLRLGAYNKNPMIEFLGRHGLQPETQNEFAPGTAERRKASVYGYGPVFRQNGKPLDLLLSNAQDEGFLPPGASESDLYDLVARAISGERVDPLYKTGSADALMQRLADERNAKEAASYEDFLAQQQALAADPDYDPFATFADTENDYDVSDLADSGYSDAERSLQAEVSALAQAYSQLGFDADDVLEPLAIQYENNPDEYYAQARQRLTQLIAQAAQPRGDSNLPQDSGEQAQAPIGREAANATSADDDALIDYAIEDDGEPDYFLQAQTARQLREREDAIAEQARLNEERQQALETKARADDERKRIAQASVQAAQPQENQPTTFKKPSEVPPKPGVYQMRDGTFARFDHGIWWRDMPTAKEALLTEFSGEDQMSPENRYSPGLAWAPYADITGRDAFGEASAMRKIPAKPADEISLDQLRVAGTEWEKMGDAQRKEIAQASGLSDTVKPRASQQVWSNFTPEMQQHLYRSMSKLQSQSPVAAAAQPQDGDILSDNGKPFAFEYGAKLRAKKEGGEVVQVAGGYVVRPTQGEATQADPVAGDKIDDEWTAFSEQSGTLGIPRAEMPQVKAQDRGAMVNFLKARGIDSSNEVMPANAIKPTQAEFSPAKVQKAAERTENQRSIIVSADGYVVDGHHQWMAQRQKGEPVKVIKLDQPIGDVLQALKEMPSAQPEQAVASGDGNTSVMPAFERYNDALDWVKERAKAQGLSVMAYRSTGEYKDDVLPQLEALYAPYKAKWDADTAEAGKAMQQAMAKDGIRAGDVVEWSQPGAFLSTEKRTGTVKIDSNGVPHVHMDSEMAVSRAGGKVGYTKKLRWQPYMQKAGANVAQPEQAQDATLANDGYVPAPPEFASFEAKISLLGGNPDLVDSNSDLGLNERGEKIARTPWDKLSQQDRAMIIGLSDSRRASSDAYNAKVRKEYWDIERRRLQGERTIQQDNGNPFKTEASAKAKLDEFDLGDTHIIRRANDGGFVLRDKRDVRESYTQAQAAVLAEMGIGESADGEIDATESQWEEVDRRTTQRLKQMLSAPESTPNQPATQEQQPTQSAISKKPAAQPQSDEEQIAAALEYADKMGLTGKERQDAVVSELAFAWDMFKDEVAELDTVKAALRKKPSKAAKEARAEQIVKDVLRQASAANKAMEDAINADDVALTQSTIDTSPTAKWRDNWGEAKRAAESLGLPTKDGERKLKLTEMVPAIKAKLAQQAAAQPEARQDDTMDDPEMAAYENGLTAKTRAQDAAKLAPAQPNTTQDQNAKNYAWIEKETGYAPMQPDGKPYILKTGVGKNEPIATSFGAKPSINDTVRYFATEEDAANWGRENGYAVGGNPYAKNTTQPSTPLARAEAELSDWMARRNLPANAGNVADVDKEINRLEQTVAALKQVEQGKPTTNPLMQAAQDSGKLVMATVGDKKPVNKLDAAAAAPKADSLDWDAEFSDMLAEEVAKDAVGNVQPTSQPDPLDYTPKQYADAWFKWVAQDSGTPLAEVRQYYGSEAGLKDVEQQWVDAVLKAANDGQVLPAKTIDKLLEVRPNTRIPEGATPSGYQRPEARKAEKEEAAARNDATPTTIKQVIYKPNLSMADIDVGDFVDARGHPDIEGFHPNWQGKVIKKVRSKVELRVGSIGGGYTTRTVSDLLQRISVQVAKPDGTVVVNDAKAAERGKKLFIGGTINQDGSLTTQSIVQSAPRDVSGLVAAAKMFLELTGGNHGDIDRLAGPAKLEDRKKIMGYLLGKDKVTQAQAGVTAIRDEFYRQAGINQKQASFGIQRDFHKWALEITGSQKAQAASTAIGQRTAGQAAKSAAKNTATAFINIVDGLVALLDSGGKLNSGLSFDEQTYAKAKPLFQAAVANLGDAGKDLKEAMRAIIRVVLDRYGPQTAQKMKTYVVQFMRDMENAATTQPQQENANDTKATQANAGYDAAGDQSVGVPENAREQRAGAIPGEPDGAVRAKRGIGSGSRAEPIGGEAGDGQRPVDVVSGDRARGTGSSGRANQRLSDYRIRPGELKRTGSWKATAEQNVRIVELVKKITAEGRQATPEEQALLTKFTGWGASEIANGIFPNQYGNYKPEWRELGERLKAALTPEEYAQAKRTTQYAHYTSEPIIRSVYGALDRMGFNGGQVLEPGMGIGLFNGLMPSAMASNTLYTGIEYDSITGNIARLLYPASNIVVGDFTATKLARDFFDAAIGNPPFGQIKIQSDPEYKKQGFLLHDYFFAKTIDRVKPGGLLVFVTSKGTMDKATDRARKYLSERADLIGAIRLPQTAFKDNAGTEVVTDVIFLKKRAEGQEPAGQAWQGLAEVQTAQGPAYVNEYFAAHPEMVLGRHAKTGSMYRADEYTVEPIEGDIEQLFAKAVQNLPKNIYRPQRGSRAERAAVQRRDYDPKIKKEGGIYVADDGTLMQVDNGQGVPLTSRENSTGKVLQLKPREIEWLKGYAGVRDALKQAQYDQLNDGPWEKSLKALNKAYDAFTKEHGPILAHTITERENDDGSVTVTRRYKNEPLIRLDAEGALVHALESINTDGSISKQAVLNGRTLNKPVTPTITNAQDAMFVSLNETGRFDMANIAKLAGKTEAEAISELGTAIYEDPSEGWTTADAYLSGNVVRKLKEAESAARIDKRYERNIEALKNVQPRALAPQDITVQLGSAWIPATDVMSFAAEVMGDTLKVSRSPVTGQWSVDGNSSRVSEWGTGDKKPTDILEGVLNNRQLKVTYRDSEGKTHTDAEATEKVNDIAKKLRREFKRWVWSDTQRADRLAKFYNENYNNIAPRQFDGSHLTLPGVSSRFNLRPHQKRAIWRTIQQGDTYYAHAVGAGKTFTMIAAGMEERRLGLAKKPMYVVPNHMLAQFSKEFLELYPTASIMVADETNFHTHNRRKFVAQAALNDPDAIVITHSAFGRIGMSPEYTAQFIRGQIYDWKDALEESDKNDRVTRKQIERRIEQLENRLKGIIDGKKDQLLSFEELGVDRLYVDEGHEFRKLDFPTNRGNIKGIDPSGSQRSMDLYMKVQYLRQKNPSRALVMASGTPVTNTMGELFTVQRFFQPAQLDEDGDDSFDAWANHYGEVVDGLEQNAAGGYETVSRFAKFVNVPELMSRVRTFMDILTSNQLGDLVQRPDVKGGGRKVVVTPVPDGYKEYQKRLDARIKAIRNRKGPPQPGDDIILSVISDGRFSAIDMRFVDPALPSDPNSKLNVTIDEMIRAYKDSQANEYATDGKADELKGGSLMLFTDIGLGEQSARSRGFDMKAWIEKRLVEGGVKPEHIAFMRDHKAHAKKERLFDDMRQGRKRILIGGKDMETGVNAQKRLVWLGHLDAPWFPASVEQREGRIIRQGNQNKAVDVKAFATKGSYDSTMWGMNSRKARFIEQAMSGDTSVRSMEDVSEASAFEMAAALASGDERYMKLAGLKADVERLNRLYSAHMDDQKRLRGEKMTTESSIEHNREQIDQINAALSKREPVKAGEFRAQVGGVTFGKREEFSIAIHDKFKRLAEAYTDGEQQLGTIGGFPIRYIGVELRDGNFVAELSLDLPGDAEPLAVFPVEAEFSVAGIATRAANQVNGLERELAKKGSFLSEQAARLEKINRRLGATFPEQSELNEKREALGELEKELEAESKANEAAQAQSNDVPTEGATAFSRRATAATNTSLPTAQAQAVVRDLQSGWSNAPAVVVVQDLQDPRVPQSVREANARQVAAGAAGVPDGFIHGETVYLVASQMRSPADAARVLLHEALGHYGLRGVFGENLSPILRDLASKRRRDVVEMAVRYGLVPDGTATDASVADIYQAMTSAQREQAAEELLAYMAQYQPELGFVQRAIAAIRQWLKSTFPMLGERLALLDSDIVANYITPARAFVEGGRPRVQAHRTAKAQSNLMDVLAALDESGVVEINC